MCPVGVGVVVVNQPIARRSPIATGDPAKNHAEAILRGSGNDLVVSVPIARLRKNPSRSVVDDRNWHIDSGPIGGESKLYRCEGLLGGGWRCVVCGRIHWAVKLSTGDDTRRQKCGEVAFFRGELLPVELKRLA